MCEPLSNSSRFWDFASGAKMVSKMGWWIGVQLLQFCMRKCECTNALLPSNVWKRLKKIASPPGPSPPQNQTVRAPPLGKQFLKMLPRQAFNNKVIHLMASLWHILEWTNRIFEATNYIIERKMIFSNWISISVEKLHSENNKIIFSKQQVYFLEKNYYRPQNKSYFRIK